MTGRDLIVAAATRAQLSQIEKYNSAANTFKGKYGYLPGDIPAAPAAQFGFIARGTTGGTGDGNGIVEGTFFGNYGGIYNCGTCQTTGETSVFWVDLSAAHLIDGSFTTANNVQQYGGIDLPPSLFLPAAKLGNNNYVFVWGDGVTNCCTSWSATGKNFFGVSNVIGVNYVLDAKPGMTVQQAYNMDKKVDDGLPQSGHVLALMIDFNTYGGVIPAYGWAGTTILANTPYTTATAGTSTSCFDNGGVAGVQKYSLSQNNGNGVNCALSFQFQ